MPAAANPRHPIGVVAERTGLTADVLRAWERRYAVVKARTSARLRELEKRMPANARLLVGGTGSKALKRPSAGSDTIFIETMEDLRTTLAAIANRR